MASTLLDRVETRRTIADLPEDIIFIIASFLSSNKDRVRFGTSSSRLLLLTLSAVYTHLTLTVRPDCLNVFATMRMLRRNPQLSARIRRVTVIAKDCEDRDGRTVTFLACRELIHLLRDMEVLSRFDWISEEPPPLEMLWVTLKSRCPNLRHVKLSFGAQVPTPESALYQLQGLTGFELNMTVSFVNRLVPSRKEFAGQVTPALFLLHGSALTDPNEYLTPLWEMLINRCPDLEALTLEGPLRYPIPVDLVSEGHWPKLKSLNLVDVIVNWDEINGTVNTSRRSFNQFLESHESIKRLTIQGTMSQLLDLRLETSALPGLESYTGIASHVTHLPNLRNIHTLRISRPLLGPHPIVAHGLLAALSSMINLTSLELLVLLHPSLTCGEWILRQLANACPNVENFEFSCTRDRRVTFPKFMDCLSGMHQLKRMTYRTLDIGSENYEAAALDMLSASRSLVWLKLRFFGYNFGEIRTPLLYEGVFVAKRDNSGVLLFTRCEKHRFADKLNPWWNVIQGDFVQLFVNWSDLRIAALRAFVLQISALLVMLAITLHRTFLVLSLLFQHWERSQT